MTATQRESMLVQRAVAGDTVALTALLTESRRQLCGYVAERIPTDLRTDVDADDIIQNALVDVFRSISSFVDQGPGSFFRWLATIALRRLRDAIRKRRAARRGGPSAQARGCDIEDSLVALIDLAAAPGRTPSQSVARHEAIRAVRGALEVLPEDYRRAIWLVNIEGRSVAAAAEQMGRSERAVHNLCYKARLRLRELLGAESRYFSQSG